MCYEISVNLENQLEVMMKLSIISYFPFYLQAEIQLNLQKRRGHGLLSVLRPKFSGVLGEALDVAVRWSGDVVCITTLQIPLLMV